jgi:hypothetical protein
MDAESQQVEELKKEIERLKAEILEVGCWASAESQIVSGCRDDYERGRYDALREVVSKFQRAREATQ